MLLNTAQSNEKCAIPSSFSLFYSQKRGLFARLDGLGGLFSPFFAFSGCHFYVKTNAVSQIIATFALAKAARSRFYTPYIYVYSDAMTEKQITPAMADDDRIRGLYQTAFPEEEQIPYEDLKRLMTAMSLDFTAYYEDSEFLGFTIVYPRPSFNWFWYFAVREELRGQGYGQQILSRLMAKYKDSANILDMESPDQECDNREQRRRRHAFYLRNGFRDTGVGKSFDGVDMTILMNGEGIFTSDDYDTILQELRTFWTSMPTEKRNITLT